MNKQSLIVFQLSLMEGIGPITIKLLHSKGLAFLLSTPTVSEIQNYYTVRVEVAQRIHTALQSISAVDNERTLAEKYGILIVTRTCSEYPAILTHLYAPPSVLYVYGAIDTLSTDCGIAIVGARDIDYGATDIISSLINPLVGANCVVISGGARGIDTLSHRATLDSGGRTVVVLGSGILRPYPQENKSLFERIAVSDGAVISTFPLQAPPRASHFPARNRVIAGLCQTCVVVQAAKKSGALITAQYALDMGKEVLAVPGSILNARFDGCNALIKQGAGLVQSSQDILDSLPVYSSAFVATSFDQQLTINMSKQSNPLLEALSSGAKDVEILMHATQLSKEEVEERLFEMQLDGFVIQHPNGQWALQ